MSSSNQNQQILTGHLVADAQIKPGSRNVNFVTFRVACNDEYVSGTTGEIVKHTEFFTIELAVTDAQRPYYERNFRRGALIFVSGKTRTREWTDDQGKKNFFTAVKTDSSRVELLKHAGQGPASPHEPQPRARDSEATGTPSTPPASSPERQPEQQPSPHGPVQAPPQLLNVNLMDFDKPPSRS